MISSDGKQQAQDNQPDLRITDLLAAHLDSLLAGQDELDPGLERFGLTPKQTTDTMELLSLSRRLRENLTPVAPSEDFVSRLQGELVGNQPVTLLVRWRKLPPHYQLAAKLGGLTLTAGILLLAAGRALTVLDAINKRNRPENDSALSLPTAS